MDLSSDILGYLLALAGLSFSLIAIIHKWHRPKCRDAYPGLIVQLNRKHGEFVAAENAEKRTKLVELLDVAKKLGFDFEIDDVSIICLLAGLLFVIASGIILIEASGQVTDSASLSLLNSSTYAVGAGAFFFFSVALYQSLRLGFSLRRL